MDFDIERDKNLKVHFIGIGGISMSGLAETLLHHGYKVSGSDANKSSITDRLAKKGAKINIGHDSQNVKDADLIVYTAAVKWDNPELIEGKAKGIKIVDRAEFLGQIMKQYKYSVAVSGTHGKTTTTSLISIIMKNAELDPTIMVGGELDAIGGNVRPGKSPYFITEACEYVESFLSLYPYVGIILNVDSDHLDYYKDINHIIDAFTKFAKLVPKDGYIIVNKDDENSLKACQSIDARLITFGFSEGADWVAKNIEYDEKGCGSFDAYFKGQLFGPFKLNVPGKHNVYNSLSAIACARIFDIDIETIQNSFLEFYGTHRRFEKIGEKCGVVVIDDYAHHPTEIKATLAAAKNYPHKKIWCVFQPHTYSRTIKLLDEFSCAFNDADELILTDIYAARELDTGEINSSKLADMIVSQGVNAKYIKSFDDIVTYLKDNTAEGDVIITMGAGDVYKTGMLFLEKSGQ
ncbi:UDP-N-acetylmuramate--L-alanine ligase [Oxobacter pfennigii]|uniref:UDP-N-acetylmuramate--L-alanine ligase n=1 Tax=Oxobacter pfennigii TaxID=36849 RepID=A0A0P8Y837_9CLOT|nr:UDP-N-acetylmuramate--L-alanine ligase [Oxobacter pfennigii]KPU42804.1 UDP-N-acetylmuramate--L-alanine ligase [Oxobacter pfennigii]